MTVACNLTTINPAKRSHYHDLVDKLRSSIQNRRELSNERDRRAADFQKRGVGIMAAIITNTIFAMSIEAQVRTEETPEPNPARPTVSTPATLTPVGYLQFEIGSFGATTSPEFDTRASINQVTKLTVVPRLEFLVLSEPFVHSKAGADKEIHHGEVFAGAQAVIIDGEGSRPTISVSYIRRLYASPAPELDLGTFRESGTILVSQEIAGFHYDANLIMSAQTEDGVQRAQHGQTLSISHRLKRFTISVELWHFTQPFLRANAVGNLWSVSYPLRRNLVMDAGFNRGLTATSTHWEGFVGFTYLLPHRLWPR